MDSPVAAQLLPRHILIHVKLQLESRQLKDAVDQAVAECSGLLQAHQVEIHLPSDLPAARMDINWICKVLHHLLENAAKYSEPGSPIFISAEMRESVVITSVADRGVGIDNLDKALIFDKFYRGRGQRFRVQGTGMGLAIVKAIIEAHGGQVEVTTQRSLGSVFSFTLPRG